MGPLTTNRRSLAAVQSADGGRLSAVGVGWSVERPSLAYQYAFDLCAVQVHRTGGPVAVFASSPFYARELVRRLSGEVVLRFPRDVGLDEPEIRATMGPEVNWDGVHLGSVRKGGEAAPSRAALWAEPERETWRDTLDELQRLAPPPEQVCVLGTTRLRRILPEWQNTVSQPARAPLDSIRHILRALYDLGYPSDGVYGFHGPLSLLFGTASRFPAALGWDDVVDRCFAAMRQAYAVRGWQARWSPVWVATGQRRPD